MVLFKKVNDLHKWLDSQHQKGSTTGFVPTMGALHQGHISLVDMAKKENQLVVTSIFVNPTQFNDPADFEKYPVTIEQDILQLEKAGCDVLFLPSVAEIYPKGPGDAPYYDLGYLETIFEGKFRPGHFQGVCRVVHRLLEIVQPHQLYLGQKDYQQCMVIKALLSLTGMNDVTLRIGKTLREKDGLAMSSRNMRLDKESREKAPALYACISGLNDQVKPGSLAKLTSEAEIDLIKKGFKPDYISFADADTLEPVAEWDGKRDLVILVAAFLGEVRLIDNLVRHHDQ